VVQPVHFYGRLTVGVILFATSVLAPKEVVAAGGTAPSLLSGSYIGGSSTDRVNAIATDASGNIYLAGESSSSNFPGTQVVSRSSTDAFILKLNSSGTQILYAAIVGGSGFDSARSIAVDASGNAYITGVTTSANFPTTAGALRRTANGTGLEDAFVVKLAPSGAVEYATYLGGSSSDWANAIAVDSAGAAYIVGSTNSVDFPITVNGVQTRLQGATDCFVAKLHPGGGWLAYSTYLGGQSTDVCSGVAVDALGTAAITGSTSSRNFPVAAALKETLGGSQDAFAARISADGSSLWFSTFLGGGSMEQGTAVRFTSSGSIYVAGATTSTDFVTTPGAAQVALKFSYDGYLCELKADGSALLYGTYLGGSEADLITDFAIDPDGRVFVTGFTSSIDLPLVSPLQSSFGGVTDGFMALLEAGGTRLEYSSFLGGGGYDRASAVAALPSGGFVLAGEALSNSVPNLQNRYSPPASGHQDGFVAMMLTGSPTPQLVSFSPGSGSGAAQAFTAVYSSLAGGNDIISTVVMMNGTFSATNACYFGYDKGSNGFMLLNDQGTAWLPQRVSPGSGSLSNNQCTIVGAGSSVSVSGNQLTVVYNLQFKPSFAGAKSIWSNAYSSNLQGSPWQGTIGGVPLNWTVMASSIPQLVSFSPGSGSGAAQAFTAVYSSNAGGNDIISTVVMMNAAFSATNACYFGYDKATNGFMLLNDQGTAWMSQRVSPGSGSLSNSQCTIVGAGSSVSVSGNQLTVVYNLEFKPSFAGTRSIWTNAYSSSLQGSPWQGSIDGSALRWTVTASSVPQLVSFSPASGSGATQAFTAVYSSLAGGSDIISTVVMMNASFSGTNACYFGYDKATNGFMLLNDQGSAWLPERVSPGSGSLSNSQCTILGAGSSVAVSGNQLTVVYNLQFKPSFAGAKSIYTNAYSSSLQGSPWQGSSGGLTLSWSVTASSVPQLVSFTPGNGSGAAQAFTAVYSSLAGGNDIISTVVLMNGTFSSTNACYFGYDKASNGFMLLNDQGTAWMSQRVSPGSGSLSNSQCTIVGAGSSVSVSGNDLTVVYNLQFKPSFTGAKSIWSNAYSSDLRGSPWQGTIGGSALSWTVTASSVPQLVSFTPGNGSGASQTFTAVYSSNAGGGDIISTVVMINGAFSATNACYFGYDKASNGFTLLNDQGTAWMSQRVSPGSGSLSNGQCTIVGSGSSVSVSGNQLTVVYNLQFKPSFAGFKSIWSNAYSSNLQGSPWQGTIGGSALRWTVTTE
jgi:hypothetical protein